MKKFNSLPKSYRSFFFSQELAALVEPTSHRNGGVLPGILLLYMTQMPQNNDRVVPGSCQVTPDNLDVKDLLRRAKPLAPAEDNPAQRLMEDEWVKISHTLSIEMSTDGLHPRFLCSWKATSFLFALLCSCASSYHVYSVWHRIECDRLTKWSVLLNVAIKCVRPSSSEAKTQWRNDREVTHEILMIEFKVDWAYFQGVTSHLLSCNHLIFNPATFLLKLTRMWTLGHWTSGWSWQRQHSHYV